MTARLIILSALFIVSCKQASSDSANATPSLNRPSNGQSTLIGGISIDSADQPGATQLQYAQNMAVTMHFRVLGLNAGPGNFIEALSELPPGAGLSNTDPANPMVTFMASVAGSYRLTLLVRDRTACGSTGNASCDIPAQQFGNVIANPAYDMVKTYNIIVTPAVLSPIVGTLPGIGQTTNPLLPPVVPNQSLFSKISNAVLGGFGYTAGGSLLQWLASLFGATL